MKTRPAIATLKLLLLGACLAYCQHLQAQFLPFSFFNGTPGNERCPDNFILVPPLSPYTSQEFCVAKYEMKDVGGTATSQAAGAPWGSISIANASSECSAAGFTLLTNDQWQSIARDVADTAWNWSSGTAYQGELNMGHSDNVPNSPLAASSDNDPCSGTGQTCSETVWHSQRRTNRLSNGETIWDLGGNMREWIVTTNSSTFGSDRYASQFTGSARNTFGNDSTCTNSNSSPYCGFGYGYVAGPAGGRLLRGGSHNYVGNAGIFYVDIRYSNAGPSSPALGFRCATTATPP